LKSSSTTNNPFCFLLGLKLQLFLNISPKKVKFGGGGVIFGIPPNPPYPLKIKGEWGVSVWNHTPPLPISLTPKEIMCVEVRGGRELEERGDFHNHPCPPHPFQFSKEIG
jgi:hypothetical protein